MKTHHFGYLCEKSFHLHRMNDRDDLNLYYGKFLNKLSKICLKIFLPILPLIYLFSLFLCRCLLHNATVLTVDLRTIVFLAGIFLTFILLFLIRLHTKWKTLWFATRTFLICLLIIPLMTTYRTEQYHLLLSTIPITLIYALLTFTLIQSFLISLTISIVHLTLLLHQSDDIQWRSVEFGSLVLYHTIIHIAGLYAYVQSIRRIREHFHAYETNLYEKNKFNVDCKKLNTILGHCQQSQHGNGRMSRLLSGLSNNDSSNQANRRFGTVINCNLSLNEQTRLHTSDELASLFDVLYCQIEQLIFKHQPQAKYIFDNETIVILLQVNENETEQSNIDQSCRLAIELFRFIQHVNNVTQWSLTAIIGIDYNELTILSSESHEGLAYDYSRWLREECVIINRIHVSSRIHTALRENKFYEFHSYSWTTNKNVVDNNLTYFLFSTNMYEPLSHLSSAVNNSSMIDQLTRIQAQYHVEKHLGTITLTRSLRKRSLIELTSKHLHWWSLNFKEQYLANENNFHLDFQSTYRANQPTRFIYVFTALILMGALLQALVIGHLTMHYLIIFPSVVLGLMLVVMIFLYSIRIDRSTVRCDKNRKRRQFYVYLNILICLTLSTLFLVAVQYHSILNFKSLLSINELVNRTMMPALSNNVSSSQMNATSNHTLSSPTPSWAFARQYHDYLVLSPIYPLYFCFLYRQCSWIIKTLFMISCLIVQLCLFEYIWLTTNVYFPSVHPLHHYTALTLIIFHGIILVIASYVREWLEKIDFIWLKQIDNERLTIVRQRDDLVRQTSAFLPIRVINYYLRNDSDLAVSQHYHQKYDRMALLHLRFFPLNLEHEYLLVDYLNDVECLLKTKETYAHIVMHRKSTIKEMLFSVDINKGNDPIKGLQELVELLFHLDERLKQISSLSIHLAACLHIGSVQEILIHLEKYPQIDMWSEHIALVQLLITKTQANHCLSTAPVYHLLNDLYLFRTAGSIVGTQTSSATNTNIYYLLGRLIGDNVFQGRNALPLSIGHNTVGTVQKSSTTDESQQSQSSQLRCTLNSQKEQNQIQTSTTTTTTTTTSSSVALNEQQSLLKQSSSSSRKHVRISNHLLSMENPSYRHTLLQALNAATNAQHQSSPMKKLSTRSIAKKHTPPALPKDCYVPRMIHLSDNSCWSSREAMTQSETSGSKCLILTQKMLNGSTDDNSQCKSTPPPPPPNLLAQAASLSNRYLSSDRKSFTEEDFRQLLHEQSSKDVNNPSRSLSTTNEETASSFSGWDEIPPSPLPSIKSNPSSAQQFDSVKPKTPSPLIDCYYPRRPCDLSFTVNMTTTEDDASSRTDTKSTVVASPTSTVVTVKGTVPVTVVKPAAVSSHSQSTPKYRPAPFNLARKLIAETSESALSEMSMERAREPWTQNIVYQSRQPQRARLSSSYSNLHDLVQMNHSSKYLPQRTELPTMIHSDLLQRWLEDQLNLFRFQVKQTPPLSATRKTNRFSTNVVQKTDSTDDESDTISENTFTVKTHQSNPPSKSTSVSKRPYNHVRYKPLRRNSTNTSHLVRHESLKYRNRPLIFENDAQLDKAFRTYQSNNLKKCPRRTDSSSMPRSDASDVSSSRPDNLSESVLSNLESEYDNIYTEPVNSHVAKTIMSNSQILSDDDDDDETTLATTVTTKSRCYF